MWSFQLWKLTSYLRAILYFKSQNKSLLSIVTHTFIVVSYLWYKIAFSDIFVTLLKSLFWYCELLSFYGKFSFSWFSVVNSP